MVDPIPSGKRVREFRRAAAKLTAEQQVEEAIDLFAGAAMTLAKWAADDPNREYIADVVAIVKHEMVEHGRSDLLLHLLNVVGDIAVRTIADIADTN